MIGKEEKLKRALLWGPAKIYELLVRLRVAAYETEYLKPARLEATVISIGNITLGGTGKTSFVEYIARYLKKEGHSVAVLTRGYGRKSGGRRLLNAGDAQAASGHKSPAAGRLYEEFGDEPLMLARAVPDVPVIVDKDRRAGGAWAERECSSNVLILDDGYQHLKLARNLNILLLDATDPFGGFEMVPFGRLREPLYGLKRADAVIVTRADRPFDQGQLNAIIRHSCGGKIPILYFSSSIKSLRHLKTGEVYESNQFVGWNSVAMCGIGNPRAFSDDLLQIGMNVSDESFFPDHHAFTQEDLDRVTERARGVGADCIVTTEKDAIRLEGLEPGEVPLYAAQSELQSDDEVRLKSLLLRTIALGRPRP
ncbi:MAG TPA: tetraacyldisaccharide 4'-kinase [Blastocatellia bacterium]|nr:tetraacyldisaccharide 4'-kinase [Blastocatellia bacterium]